MQKIISGVARGGGRSLSLRLLSIVAASGDGGGGHWGAKILKKQWPPSLCH